MNELEYINQKLELLKWVTRMLRQNNQCDEIWEEQYQKQTLELIKRKVHIEVYGY